MKQSISSILSILLLTPQLAFGAPAYLQERELILVSGQEVIELSIGQGLNCIVGEAEGSEKLAVFANDGPASLHLVKERESIERFKRRIRSANIRRKNKQNLAEKKTLKRQINSYKNQIVNLEMAKAECTAVAVTARCRRNGSCPTPDDEIARQESCNYTVSGLPLSLMGSATPEAAAAFINFTSIPTGTTNIELILTALDADDSNEGRLIINNNLDGGIQLFGTAARPENNDVYARVSINTPRTNYVIGNNRLLFIHDVRAGYAIANIEARCLGAPSPDVVVPTPSLTPTRTPTVAITSTRTATRTSTRTPTPTGSGLATPTRTPTRTATRTVTPTRTLTPTPTSTTGGVTCNYTINSSQSINMYSNVVNPGETVCIRAGTYNDGLRPARSGTAGSLITFKAYPGDECKGEMGKPKLAGSCKVIISGASNGADLSGRNYIRIEGFEIKNTSGAGVKNMIDWYATSYQTTGNQVRNNFIHDTGGDGIDSQNSSGLWAENNEIYNTVTSGIRFGGQLSSQNLTARGNNLHHIGKDGMQGGCDTCLFEFNTLYDSVHTAQHQDGFDIGWIKNSTIRYNSISDFTQLLYGGADQGNSKPWENLQIYGNVFFTNKYWTEQGNEAPGIFIAQNVGQGATRNISIHSNTFGWLGYGAIWIVGGGNPVSGIKVYNNIFYESGIDIDGGGSSTVSDYNLFYGVSKPSYEGSHSLTADPQFVNYTGQNSTSFDFHLRLTSPAIDRGAPNLGSLVTLPGPFWDIDQNQRPMGASYDIGAYERNP